MLTVIAEKKNISGNKIIIDNKLDCGHIQNVYRLQINDEVRVIDGEFEYLTKILSISKKEVVLEIIKKIEDNYSLDVNVDMAIGILKNDKMNLAIQKLTEIGVNKIIPLKTKRVVVKINEKKEKMKNAEILNNHHYRLSELDLEIIKSVPSGGNWTNIPQKIINITFDIKEFIWILKISLIRICQKANLPRVKRSIRLIKF